MNIMLIAVVERTHEIGIRRAVGATRGSVRRQFLLEAILMTLAGGLLGIVAGTALSRGITWYAGWPTLISVQSVCAAVAVSVGVGIASGVYPAVAAARLSPIDALRHE